MDIKTLSAEAVADINNMMMFNKDITGAVQQRDKYKIALKEITELIKSIKANRNKKISKVMGGNLVVEIHSKDMIKELQERKRQVEISLKGIEEQIRHREDNLVEQYHKAYFQLKRKIPEDMR